MVLVNKKVMNIKLYDTDVLLKTEYCLLFGKKQDDVEIPYINMYVRFKGCNAKCAFCEYMDTADNFDIDKYKEILEYIVSKVRLKRFNFTGGEPTLNYDKFKEVFDVTDSILKKDTELTINTNGLNLRKLSEDKDIVNRVDCLSLSRHHYDDDKNDEIFGVNIIDNEEIKDIQSKIKRKSILNLTCNLINGYIDNSEDVKKYLDIYSSFGIQIVGFVSLMPINDFCNENFVDFNKLGLRDKLFIKTKDYTYKDICKCNNYLYISEYSGEVVRVYYKNTYRPELTPVVLTYDGQYLRKGFDGDIIK